MADKLLELVQQPFRFGLWLSRPPDRKRNTSADIGSLPASLG